MFSLLLRASRTFWTRRRVGAASATAVFETSLSRSELGPGIRRRACWARRESAAPRLAVLRCLLRRWLLLGTDVTRTGAVPSPVGSTNCPPPRVETLGFGGLEVLLAAYYYRLVNGNAADHQPVFSEAWQERGSSDEQRGHVTGAKYQGTKDPGSLSDGCSNGTVWTGSSVGAGAM